MKTFIFWKNANSKHVAYKAVVGGALWDMFLTNARNGYGTAYLLDADTVQEAKTLVEKAKPTHIPNVYAYGDIANSIAMPKAS